MNKPVIGGRECEILPYSGYGRERFRISDANDPLYKMDSSGKWHREANMEECFVMTDWTWPTREAAEAFLADPGDNP